MPTRRRRSDVLRPIVAPVRPGLSRLQFFPPLAPWGPAPGRVLDATARCLSVKHVYVSLCSHYDYYEKNLKRGCSSSCGALKLLKMHSSMYSIVCGYNPGAYLKNVICIRQGVMSFPTRFRLSSGFYVFVTC